MNKVILTGRIANDLEIKKTNSGESALQFAVACDDGKTASGEKITDFVNCKVWKQKADFVKRYFIKGDGIVIEGKIKNNKYTNRDGVEIREQYVNIDKVEFPVPQKQRDNYSHANLQPYNNQFD